MKILNIVLILALAIVSTILTALKFGVWGVLLVVLAFGIALFFTNLDKFEAFKIFSQLFSLEAALRKTEESIKEISRNLPSWQLLLEHDENGNRIDGDIQDLIKAVYEGYPIKIRIKRSENHFEVMDAQWLFVDNNLVHASNTSQISIFKDKSGNYYIPEKPYHYFVVVNNSGYHYARRVYVGGEEHKSTPGTRYMSWIGLVPPNS